MRVLFVHQNFPGQFKHLMPALAADPANEIVVFTMNRYPGFKNIRIVRYQPARPTAPDIHPWVTDLEAKTIRGEAAFRAALALKADGFTPDIIVAHPGWGESLFLKEVWPKARMGIYCEFFYHARGADVGFDPEFPPKDPADSCRLKMKNINNLLHFGIADAGIAPTHWQHSTFPEPFYSKISVIHDGIDTRLLAPNPTVGLTLNHNRPLTRADEIITFVNRNLEPYRGYHIFMRALPEILKARPSARVLIAGGDNISYGVKPPDGRKWKDIFLNEVKDRIDCGRIHFLGTIPYTHFIALLQLSTVHVYLTYPFVLSWSLLEAMSIGCAIVACDTLPLREAITHNETGTLVDFFDYHRLASQVVDLLVRPNERERLGRAARIHAMRHYDLETVCLPQQLAWVKQLAEG
ncbi:MAG: glycosyltransferase family 4 protein [Pseudomonadota bacterium]